MRVGGPLTSLDRSLKSSVLVSAMRFSSVESTTIITACKTASHHIREFEAQAYADALWCTHSHATYMCVGVLTQCKHRKQQQ